MGPPIRYRTFLSTIAACWAMLITNALSLSVSQAQVITYEGITLPELDPTPWSRIGTFDADRWTNAGYLYHFVQLGAWAPDPYGEFEGYKRTIGEFVGAPDFFIAWRQMTDCPRSDIAGTPSGLAASGGPNVFSFTITIDQALFVRDNPVGLVLYVDIQPNVLHTYYLALKNNLAYDWYIDGILVNSGQHPSPFPTPNAQLNWAARYYLHEHTTQWDYIRYGVIPPEHSGDFNNNGTIDDTDLYYFVDCLLGPDYDAAGPGCKWADMNADGKADAADIQAFSMAMLNP